MTTLTWRNSRVQGLIEAPSARPMGTGGYTGAHYTIEEDTGFRPGAPDVAPAWLLTFVYEDEHGDSGDAIDLRRHADLDAAKAAAERYEQTGEIPFDPDPFTPEQHALATQALAAVWDEPDNTPEDFARDVLIALAQAGHLNA